MKNSPLYKLSYSAYSAYLPVLQEPDQQVVWSKNEFEEGTILLYLQDFGLREENLNTAVAINRAEVACAGATTTELAATEAGAMSTTLLVGGGYIKIWNQARKEFKETRKIKGSLFLTPDFQKIWLSHYDVKCLIKVSWDGTLSL